MEEREKREREREGKGNEAEPVTVTIRLIAPCFAVSSAARCHPHLSRSSTGADICAVCGWQSAE